MSHPVSEFIFLPKPSKKLVCSERKFPPTSLVNGRKTIGVDNHETISAQGIGENDYIGVEIDEGTSAQGIGENDCIEVDIDERTSSQGIGENDYIGVEIDEGTSPQGIGENDGIEVDIDEGTSAQGIDEDEKSVNKVMTRSSSKNLYSSIKSSQISSGLVNTVSRSNSMIKPVNNPFGQKVNGSSNKKKIWRCNRCENCLKVNCKSCRACKNMRKYGGPGTMKLSCLMRPNCFNVFVPTLEKREKIDGAFEKKSVTKVIRHKKIEKVNDRNKNTIKLRETNREKDIFEDEEIPPYKPRMFPLKNEDYEKMVAEQGSDDNHENFNSKKNIPIPNWLTTEQEHRKINTDTDDNDAIEEMCKLRDALMKANGDFNDFEDISDEVYKLRHARAAALEDDIKEDGDDSNRILDVQETSIGL